MRPVLPFRVLPLLLAEANAALAQPAKDGATPGPSMPIPGNADAGNYWYWVAAVIAIIALVWGVPRFLRLIKGSSPRRKP
jgi:hypothetical protein